MAGLEKRNGRFNVIIRFGGKRFVRSLKTTDENEATELVARLERRQRLVETGDLDIPDGADVPTFLLTDGKRQQKPRANETLTLSALFEDFFATLPSGSHEDSTLSYMQIHRRHFERIIGKRFAVQTLAMGDLQSYVTKRSKERGRRGTVSASTIKKELVTFGSVWAWGAEEGKLVGGFPRKGVRLPKEKDLPPFQTWTEIEEQTDDSESELWDCLYLTMSEIEKLLEDARENAAFPFIHPMMACAAYTGARRSELIRSELSDIDLRSKVLTIREKKRVRRKMTTRRVPISDPLLPILAKRIKTHPGGRYTFCHQATRIARSRKKRNDCVSLTRNEAHHHFKQTLDGSKWQVVTGWHCLRHSFISNCASKGIDQRMIDEWVGHTTEDMRRRYRHLFPSAQQDAMKLLFA